METESFQEPASVTAGSSRGQMERRLTLSAFAILLILALSYAVNAADRNVFPVLLGGIRQQFGFSLEAAGLLSTVFTLGLGIGGIPAGRLMDRLSRKTVMLIGIFVYSAFTLLTPLALGYGDMMAYRVFSGVGEALQNAALFTAVGAYFYATRSTALGILNISYGFGGTIGPYLGAVLATRSGHWQLPFYIYAAVGFAFCAIILFGISKRYTEAADQKHRDVQTGPHSGAKGSWAEGPSGYGLAELPSTLLNRNTALICASIAVAGFCLYSYLGLYPTYLETQLGFSVDQAGFAASMFGLGSLAASVPAGWLGDKLGNRTMSQISFIGVPIIAFFMFFVAKTPTAQSTLSFLEGAFGSGTIYVNLYAYIQRSLSSGHIGRASGAFVTYFFLPSTVAGYFFGYVVHHGSWCLAAVSQLVILPLVGLVIVSFVRIPRRRTNGTVTYS